MGHNLTPWSVTEAKSLVVDRHDPLPGVEVPVIAHQAMELKMPEARARVDEKLLWA